MKTRALLLGSLLVTALAVYDVVQAATLRCIRTADKQSVVMLDELDALPRASGFTLEATRSGTRPWRAGVAVRSRRGMELAVRGTAPDAWRAYGTPAVFADVDGHARLLARRSDGDAARFNILIPSYLLGAGVHRVKFAFVKSDLSGYFVAPVALLVSVNP